MKAQELNGAHLGRKIRVTNGEGFDLTDTLTEIHHAADLVDDRRAFDAEPHWIIGRHNTALTFMNAGQITVSTGAELEVIK